MGRIFALAAFFLTVFFTAACGPSRAPTPPGEVPPPRPISVEDEQYGHKVFQEMTEEYEQDYNHPRSIEVQNIVERLTKAAGAGNDPWHVYIFKDASVKNAAATRGNHIFIWSGLLDSTKNEDELAVILSHEISHVLVGHTDPDPNEEVKKLLINLGAMAAGIAVSYSVGGSYYGGDLGNLTSAVTEQIANSLLLYPYSQDNEHEADQVGLFLMARAKYNPQAAIDFWSRAQQDPELSGNLGFLSTHPPAGDRVEHLKALLPQAIAQYNGNYLPYAPPQAQQQTAQQTGQQTGAQPPVQVAQAGQIPPPFDPQLDSFDISVGKAPTTMVPKISVGKIPEPTTDWLVTSNKAVVYTGPTTTSRALGELRRGARVQVAETRGAWLRIIQPDEGFVRKSALRPDQPAGGASSPGAVIPSVR